MTVEERVSRLERSLRRWRLGACLAAVTAVGMGALRPIPREVEARNFVVRDDDGKVRAVLGLRDAIKKKPFDVPETPMLLLFGPDGAEKPPALDVAILPAPVGAQVAVHGANGKYVSLNQMGLSFADFGPMGTKMRESDHKRNLEFMPGDK
jgi:hypothetical protein